MDRKLNCPASPARRPTAALSCGALLAALLVPSFAFAQATPPPVADEEDATATAPGEDDPLTSNEEGVNTPLEESFGPKSHAQWVRETRRKALDDTKINVQVRSYYMDRDKYDDSQSEAWALGGSIGLKTGYFRERFSMGATAFTSQPLHAPEDKDGTGLLAPGQRGYTSLGEVYGEFLINDQTRLTIGRRMFDTPYINRNDARMTPVSFEAIALQGLYGSAENGEWRVGAGYFDKIKERTTDDFVSMSDDAGAPDDVDNGVFALGANYRIGDFSIGAIDYYSADIINIFYAEGKYSFTAGEKSKLTLSFQYSDETSVGDELLKGTSFDSNQWGLKADWNWGNASISGAYTTAGGNANMQNPWSGYPGYTSVQVEDFNRDGEDAWMLRGAYKFQAVKGLSVYALYVDGSDPDSPSEYAKNEWDFNLQWDAPEGRLKGLMARLRYAEIDQDAPGVSTFKDLRVMVYWTPQTP
jgi:hypothetical protein